MKLTETQIIEMAAAAAHEANHVYCLALGDTSQESWANAPDWQKLSVVAGVHNILHNQDTIAPRASHEEWLAYKRAEGWIYGPVKDPEKKTHPCCVPYDELPNEQRLKDVIFLGIVLAVIKATADY